MYKITKEYIKKIKKRAKNNKSIIGFSVYVDYMT